jgi:hypothetical protein
MQDKLLEYVIGLLDGEEAASVNEILAGDAGLQSELHLLRLGLAPLEPLRQDVDAPQGLAVRTCVRIREIRQCRAP